MNMGEASVTLPKGEFDLLVRKANLFDQYVETEELSKKELKQIKKALKGPFISKAEFLKRHPELN